MDVLGSSTLSVVAPQLLFSPVPRLEGIAGPLEQVALHHHAVGGVQVKLHL